MVYYLSADLQPNYARIKLCFSLFLSNYFSVYDFYVTKAKCGSSSRQQSWPEIANRKYVTASMTSELTWVTCQTVSTQQLMDLDLSRLSLLSKIHPRSSTFHSQNKNNIFLHQFMNRNLFFSPSLYLFSLALPFSPLSFSPLHIFK